LLPGTLIQTAAGERPIEAVGAVDTVVAGRGLGDTGLFPVSRVYRRPYSGDVLEIATASGHKICCTPEHALFTRLVPHLGTYYVYLMRHKDRGYRVGITRGYRSQLTTPGFIVNGLSSRCHQEGGDGIWVLRRCDNRKEAQTHEQLYLARYGLPGLCFKAAP